MIDEDALRLEQKPERDLLAAAKAFYRNGDYPKACRWLRAVVAREPWTSELWGRERWESEAHYWLGAALVKRGRYREAIASLLEAERRKFNRPDVQLRLGEAYQAQSERKLEPEAERLEKRKLALDAFAQAIKMAGTIPFMDGSLGEAHLGVARAEEANNQPDAALASLQVALRAEPDALVVQAGAQERLRSLLARRTDREVRLTSLRGIVRRARLPEPYVALAITYDALDHPDAALWERLRAIWRYEKIRLAGQASDTSWLDGFSYDLAYRPGLSDAAVEKLERLLRRRPPPLVEAAVGLSLLTGGRVDLGITVLARTLERAPADSTVCSLVKYAIDRHQNPKAKQKLLETLGLVVQRVDSAEGYIAGAIIEVDPQQALANLTHAVNLAEASRSLDACLNSVVRAIRGIEIEPAHAKQMAALVDRVERTLPPTTDPQTLVGWAMILASQGQPHQSLERMRQALAAGDAEDETWQWELHPTLSALHSACDGNPDLLDALTTVVTDSGNPRAHSALANSLIVVDRWKEAERVCQAWAKLAPEDAAPYRLIGQIYTKQRQFDRAIAAYECAIERVPDTSVYGEYLVALREMDNESDAIGALVAVAKQWKDSVDEQRPAWSEIERKHDRILRKVLRLVEQFEEQADNAGELPGFVFELSNYGLHDQGARLCEKYYNLQPDNFRQYSEWGTSLYLSGNPIRALRLYRRATKAGRAGFWVHIRRAHCHVALGRMESASHAFERALSSANANADRTTALSAWVTALSNAGLNEQALARADQACRIDENDYWALFCKGYVLASMGAYEQAKVYYDQACQADPSLPHAQHNLVGVLESQGLYRAARKQIDQTLEVYAGGLENRLRDRDPYLFRFHATISEKVKQEKRAEDLLRMALLLEPDNPEHEVALASFYFARDKISATVARPLPVEEPRAAQIYMPARLKAIEHYRRAEAGLKRRLGFARTTDARLSLADLHMAAGEFEKARPQFEEAARRQPTLWRAYKGLGECHLKLGDAKAAIRCLERALQLAPGDLESQSLAAQAYRRAEKLDEAEEAYRRVLQVSDTHVDARVGLGELYLDMAERRAEQEENSTILAELYGKAVNELQCAVDLFDTKDAPLTIASRKSSIQYLLGYAQWKLHKTALLTRDNKLLSSAVANFRASDKAHLASCGEPHIKARRAIDMLVSERRGPIQSWVERHGAAMVVCMAIGLFLLAQAGLILGRPVSRELLTLSERTFTTVKAMGVPEDVIKKAKLLESVSFQNAEAIAALLKDRIGPEDYGKHGGHIIAAVERGAAKVSWENIDLASYLTLTFGAVLLLIAGAYLPQITSLKLAGVQLEKASAERVETRTAVTISR